MQTGECLLGITTVEPPQDKVIGMSKGLFKDLNGGKWVFINLWDCKELDAHTDKWVLIIYRAVKKLDADR